MNIELKSCQSCGTKMGLDAEFCPNCGEKVNQLNLPMESNKIELKNCPSCGTKAGLDAEFCPNCGEKYSGEKVSQSKFCRDCGVQLPSYLIFCPSCGSNKGISHSKLQYDEKKSKKRPGEITAIGVFFIIIGLFGIFGLPIIFTDWYLKSGWVIAIPLFGLLNLITAYGIWEYKEWSYYLAFLLIILDIILLIVIFVETETDIFMVKGGLVLIGLGMLKELYNKDIRKLYMDYVP